LRRKIKIPATSETEEQNSTVAGSFVLRCIKIDFVKLLDSGLISKIIS